ncbi:hypothetical protein SKAU_G00186980 [Synaphobranchus kaupii]|uniref:Uncharacterized protein n=1 Tax=Synaphobranchus kaupii TaxID=118154 RepID=A0A9Q1FCX3_SYNKA|nr:hypothetical protein SKAU_G00186980 [Synaphobranchus kaupii]
MGGWVGVRVIYSIRPGPFQPPHFPLTRLYVSWNDGQAPLGPSHGTALRLICRPFPRTLSQPTPSLTALQTPAFQHVVESREPRDGTTRSPCIGRRSARPSSLARWRGTPRRVSAVAFSPAVAVLVREPLSAIEPGLQECHACMLAYLGLRKGAAAKNIAAGAERSGRAARRSFVSSTYTPRRWIF